MFRIVSIYVCAFILLTATDIGTTLWASSIGAAQEFNHAVATPEGLLAVERMLLINGAMLLFTAGMLVWALRNADRIAPRYLGNPPTEVRV
jgi:pimeloyl-ACP methyl ester carboxylesterase